MAKADLKCVPKGKMMKVMDLALFHGFLMVFPCSQGRLLTASGDVSTGGSFASPNDAAAGFTFGRTPHIDALGSGGLHQGVGCVVLALKSMALATS